jgi:hypothetical protein
MLHTTKRRTNLLGLALPLLCLPLILAGCGGGNGGGIVQPTLTPTLPSAPGGVNLQLTNATDATLPASLDFFLPQGQLYTQAGTTNLHIQLDSKGEPGVVDLDLGRTGTLTNPQAFIQEPFVLTQNGNSSAPLDNTLSYNVGGQTYVSQSGTCLITRATPVPTSNTVTMQFILTDVKMVNYSDSKSTFTFNGTGTVTLNQFAL